MKLFLAFVIAILLLIQASLGHGLLGDIENSPANVEEEVNLASKLRPKKINCGHACSKRCKLASRKNVCHRACRTCCARCGCVPPGTYGHQRACPCYASLRTHGNKPKCP